MYESLFCPCYKCGLLCVLLSHSTRSRGDFYLILFSFLLSNRQAYFTSSFIFSARWVWFPRVHGSRALLSQTSSLLSNFSDVMYKISSKSKLQEALFWRWPCINTYRLSSQQSIILSGEPTPSFPSFSLPDCCAFLPTSFRGNGSHLRRWLDA